MYVTPHSALFLRFRVPGQTFFLALARPSASASRRSTAARRNGSVRPRHGVELRVVGKVHREPHSEPQELLYNNSYIVPNSSMFSVFVIFGPQAGGSGAWRCLESFLEAMAPS